MSLAPIERAVQAETAQDRYRAHLFSDCQPCAGGHWCAIRDRLDYLAAVADTRKGARRDR